jgi:hypothetical protein
MKNFRSGFSILETMVAFGIVGLLTSIILKQQDSTNKVFKKHQGQEEIIGKRLILSKAFSNSNLCTSNLSSLGVIPQVDSILAGNNLVLDSGNIITNEDGGTLAFGAGTKEKIQKIIFRGVSNSEVIADVYFGDGVNSVGLKEIRRSFYINLFKQSGTWECLGSSDASELEGKMRNFCASLGTATRPTTFFEETGECLGAVTEGSLARICTSMNGSFYTNGKICSGVPGMQEIGNLCQSMGGVSVTDASDFDFRKCTNIPHNLRREDLCVKLATITGSELNLIDGTCTNFNKQMMEQFCEDGMKGVYNADADVCQDPLGGKFRQICEEGMGGTYDEITNECGGLTSKVEIAEKFCNSLAGGSAAGAYQCNGVQETFFNNFCTGSGGRVVLSGGGVAKCEGPNEAILTKFCDSFEYGGTTLNADCVGVLDTFDDFCEALGGEYNANTKKCDQLEEAILKNACEKLPMFKFEDGECLFSENFVCSGGEVLVGNQCQNIRALLEGGSYLGYLGGNCAIGNFVNEINQGIAKCESPGESLFYAGTSSTESIMTFPSNWYETQRNWMPKQLEMSGENFISLKVARTQVRFSRPSVDVYDITKAANYPTQILENLNSIHTSLYVPINESTVTNWILSNCHPNFRSIPMNNEIDLTRKYSGEALCPSGSVVVDVGLIKGSIQGTKVFQCRSSANSAEFVENTFSAHRNFYQVTCMRFDVLKENNSYIFSHNSSPFGADVSEHRFIDEYAAGACSNDKVLIGIAPAVQGSALGPGQFLQKCGVVIYKKERATP